VFWRVYGNAPSVIPRCAIAHLRMSRLAQARNPYSLWQSLKMTVGAGDMDSQMRNCAS
jgi:hypothetical protein